MEYLKIDEAAAAWGISTRRLQTLCAAGKIGGATRFGRAWMIPKDAKKPVDGRTKAGRAGGFGILDVDMPMPRKTPFLYMTNLYYAPGCAEEAVAALADNPEAQRLLAAEIACARGEIDKVYESANYFLNKHSGFYAVLAAGTLLAQCAIWRGDLNMWRKAKIHLAEAPIKNDNDREVIELAISAVDIMLYSVESFPKWFQIGCFEPLHEDAYPAAKVYYAKFLYAVAYSVATGKLKLPGAEGLYVMSSLPYTLEPMICWAKERKTVMSEIYLRLTCAAVYHSNGNDKEAIRHIDRALSLALPDRFYGVLAEYCRTIGTLIEARLALVDEAALGEVKRLSVIYSDNWSKLSSKITGKQIVSSLSAQNRQVARLAAFKLSDAEIARRTNMSLSGVKQAIRIIKEKSGLERDEFAAIL